MSGPIAGHEAALQKALIAHLKADAAVAALVGARIWDGAPERPAHPHLTLGRCESRPVGADGGGIEHRLTLACVSKFSGSEEAKAVLAAVRARLEGARIEADGVRTVSLGVGFADVFPAPDRARVYAVMRVRAVTEEG